MEDTWIKSVNIDDLLEPEQPLRLEANDEYISNLADSIQSNGLINPLTIIPKDEKYEIVAGHRRYLACKEAGLRKIPCRIISGDSRKKISISLSENLARRDMSPMEEASTFKEIQENWNWSCKQIGRIVGKSHNYVNRKLSLLDLPNDLQLLLHERKLGMDHAHVLAEIEDEYTRQTYTDEVIKRKTSVHTLREWVANLKAINLYDTSPDEETIEAMKLSAQHKTYHTCQICDGAFEINNLTQLLVCKNCAIKVLEAKKNDASTSESS